MVTRARMAERREEGRRLYESGHSAPEIAALLGAPIRTVRDWATRGKWSSGAPGQRAGRALAAIAALRLARGAREAIDRIAGIVPEGPTDATPETVRAVSAALRDARDLVRACDALLLRLGVARRADAEGADGGGAGDDGGPGDHGRHAARSPDALREELAARLRALDLAGDAAGGSG